MKKGCLSVVILSLCIIVLIVGSRPQVAYTKSTKEKLEEAKEQHEETKKRLEETKNNITYFNNIKNNLEVELDNLNVKLTEVSNKIAELEEKIAAKEVEIAETEIELEEATEAVDSQYEAMKKRIQFMYEKKDTMMVDILFASSGFGDMLNKSDYIEQLESYDRLQLILFQETREKVELAKAKLEQEKEELDQYKEETVAEQSKVSGYIKNTNSSIIKYASQMKEAENSANEISKEIAAQEKDIAALQKKLQEEIELSKKAAKMSWRNISEIEYQDGDRYLLANIIYCEAGNQPYEGQVAVGAVVMNRVRSAAFPNTIVGVIYAPRQFSPVDDGHLAIALANDKATDACYRAADDAMAGASPVGNCLFFRTPIPGLTGIQIGGHIFY